MTYGILMQPLFRWSTPGLHAASLNRPGSTVRRDLSHRTIKISTRSRNDEVVVFAVHTRNYKRFHYTTSNEEQQPSFRIANKLCRRLFAFN